MIIPNSINVAQLPDNGEWRVVACYSDIGPVTHLATTSRSHALRQGRVAADYHGIPLFINGQRVAYKRFSDPKSFGGITRPAGWENAAPEL